MRIKRAWWDVDQSDEDGSPLEGSPAWVVGRMFKGLVRKTAPSIG